MNTVPESSLLSNQSGEIGPGHVLGRYELLLPIAAGGMAMVWAARLRGTRGFQKIVAVKTMLPKLSEDEQFEQMFLDEASLASQIRHPHVVEISDLGEQEGVLYLVMEWIDGVPLNQLMKASRATGGVPIPVAVRIAMQACAGLHAAHELKDASGKLVGLVHRDVSPQNILVTHDGVAKVVDFGVAKATALGGGATVAGQIKGKVAYMAPEQVKGGDIDRRVDVFAMGIVLYALTTGKHPFRRESEAATMYNICAPQPVMPPSRVLPEYPPELEAIVLKSLAKEPADRFQSANEMLRALDQLPTAMRASTDEEVSICVEGLFGAKRLERKAALAEALTRADDNLRTRGSHTGFPNEPMRQSIHSTVSMVTRTGVTGGELSGVPSVSGAIGPAGTGVSMRRRLVIGGSLAVVALLAFAVVFALAQKRSTAKVALQPSPSAAVVSASSVASAPAPEASVNAAPAASGMAVSPTLEVARPTKSVHSPRATSSPAAAPANKPTPRPAQDRTWKHDPGF